MKKHPLIDPVLFFSSPEFQSYFEINILRPILAKVLNYVYPYLVALTMLWVIMFLCMIVILFVLFKARI
jgi:hypothetical protein